LDLCYAGLAGQQTVPRGGDVAPEWGGGSEAGYDNADAWHCSISDGVSSCLLVSGPSLIPDGLDMISGDDQAAARSM
jgi:hypothetical protein